jgi:hypothetical protein
VRWLWSGALIGVLLCGCGDGGASAPEPPRAPPPATTATAPAAAPQAAAPRRRLLRLHHGADRIVVGQLDGWRVFRRGARMLVGRRGATPRAIGGGVEDDVRPEVGTDAAGRVVIATWRGSPGATRFWLTDVVSGAERSVAVPLAANARVVAVSVAAGRLTYVTTSGRHRASALWAFTPGDARPRRLADHRGMMGELDSGPYGVAYMLRGNHGATSIRLKRPGRPERVLDEGAVGVMEGSYEVGSPSFSGHRLLWRGTNSYDNIGDLYRLDLRTGDYRRMGLGDHTIHVVAGDADRPRAPALVTYDAGDSDYLDVIRHPTTAAVACERCWTAHDAH